MKITMTFLTGLLLETSQAIDIANFPYSGCRQEDEKRYYPCSAFCFLECDSSDHSIALFRSIAERVRSIPPALITRMAHKQQHLLSLFALSIEALNITLSNNAFNILSRAVILQDKYSTVQGRKAGGTVTSGSPHASMGMHYAAFCVRVGVCLVPHSSPDSSCQGSCAESAQDTVILDKICRRIDID
jgi:hypothetical protein